MTHTSPSTVLVVAAHGDDEALGCGGTLAWHAAKGDTVHALFLTDGVASRGSDAESAARRFAAIERAAEILGIAKIHTADFPDNAMDTIPLLKIAQAIEAVVKECSPAIVYTHHAGDLNIDHELAHRAVLTACRPQPGHCVEAIYSFEVPSATDYAGPAAAFIPRRFVDISQTWGKKKASLEAYAEEMRPYPHTRSVEAIEALAKRRGSAVGFAMAEAFDVIRERISS